MSLPVRGALIRFVGMDSALRELQAETDVARAAYGAERTRLKELLVPLFHDHEEACHTLISAADEFGPEFARGLLDRPNVFGSFHEAAIDIEPETREAIEAQLEGVLDAHDRLDVATARREDYWQSIDPTHERVINFDGREWVVDENGREIRAADGRTERVSIAEMAEVNRAGTVDQQSLTERLRGEAEVPLAQPAPERDRNRTR